MNLHKKLQIFSLIAQIISFPIVALSIYLTQVESKQGRDVEIALTLAESFRSRWETGWQTTLREVSTKTEFTQPVLVPVLYQEYCEHYYEPIVYMLNWVDWVGIFMTTESLTNEEVVFGSLQMQFEQIINAGRPIIQWGVDEKGLGYWKGILTVGKRLQIDWVEELAQGDGSSFPNHDSLSDEKTGYCSISKRPDKTLALQNIHDNRFPEIAFDSHSSTNATSAHSLPITPSLPSSGTSNNLFDSPKKFPTIQ